MIIKVNPIHTNIASTGGLITNTQNDSDKQSLEKKIEDVDKMIPNTLGLAKKTDYKTKIVDIENKIPGVTGLVTTTVLNKKPQRLKTKYLILLTGEKCCSEYKSGRS